jgi:type III pantothenate kinase
MSRPSFAGVIDVGNSGLKLALADTLTGRLVAGTLQSCPWRSSSTQLKPPPPEWRAAQREAIAWDDPRALTSAIRAMLQRSPSSLAEPPVDWYLSCVQPLALASLQQAVVAVAPGGRLTILQQPDIELRCDVDFPQQVGIDRLLAAWAAWELSQHQGPLMVIQAGTAITVDWVNESGHFQGGAIMPGMAMMLKFLSQATARLPWLAPTNDMEEVVVPGRNTEQAMMAGVVACCLGGVAWLRHRYQQQYAGDRQRIQVYLSGGDGFALSHAMEGEYHLVDQLVLRGLAMFAARARKE